MKPSFAGHDQAPPLDNMVKLWLQLWGTVCKLTSQSARYWPDVLSYTVLVTKKPGKVHGTIYICATSAK